MPTVLLVHFDAAPPYVDVSPSAHTLTSAGATLDAPHAKFGAGCVSQASAAAGTVIGAPNSDFDFQNGQFTIEVWGNANGLSTNSMVSQFNAASGGGFFFGSISGNLGFYHYNGAGSLVAFTSATSVGTGAYHFYTVDRDAGGTIRLYIDGVVVASTNSPTFQAAAVQTNIGNSNRGNDGWLGYLDEIRVTKGTALYAGAFTPPTGPFTNGGAAAAQARAMMLA